MRESLLTLKALSKRHMKRVLFVVILFFAIFTYIVVRLTNEQIADIRANGASSATTNPKLPNTQSPDLTSPTISITTPQNTTQISPRSIITIRATASDNIGVDRVTFSVGGNTSTVYSPPFTYAWSVPDKIETEYKITATAFDLANNRASQSITVTSSQ